MQRGSNVHQLRPMPAPDKEHYPVKVKDTQRPYRLWDSTGKKNLAHRCYATDRRAHDMALQLARWDLKVGQSLEVWRVDAIQFTKA